MKKVKYQQGFGHALVEPGCQKLTIDKSKSNILYSLKLYNSICLSIYNRIVRYNDKLPTTRKMLTLH